MILPLVLVAGVALVASGLLVRRLGMDPAAGGRHRRHRPVRFERRRRAVGFERGGLPLPGAGLSVLPAAQEIDGEPLASWPGQFDEPKPWWHRGVRLLSLLLVIVAAATAIAAALWLLGHVAGQSMSHYFKSR